MDNQNLYSPERETELWRDGGEPLLTVTMDFPVFIGIGRPVRRVNAFYARRNKKFVELCKKTMLPKLIAQPPPKQARSVCLRSKVTYSDDTKICVLTEINYSTFALPNRNIDLWDRRSGTPLPLSALLSKPKRTLKRFVLREVARRKERGLADFYPDAVKRAQTHFSMDNVYITGDGTIAVYYPPNTIAPNAAGFPTFLYTLPTKCTMSEVKMKTAPN